jgi:hypothetical protein
MHRAGNRSRRGVGHERWRPATAGTHTRAKVSVCAQQEPQCSSAIRRAIRRFVTSMFVSGPREFDAVRIQLLILADSVVSRARANDVR